MGISKMDVTTDDDHDPMSVPFGQSVRHGMAVTE